MGLGEGGSPESLTAEGPPGKRGRVRRRRRRKRRLHFISSSSFLFSFAAWRGRCGERGAVSLFICGKGVRSKTTWRSSSFCSSFWDHFPFLKCTFQRCDQDLPNTFSSPRKRIADFSQYPSENCISVGSYLRIIYVPKTIQGAIRRRSMNGSCSCSLLSWYVCVGLCVHNDLSGWWGQRWKGNPTLRTCRFHGSKDVLTQKNTSSRQRVAGFAFRSRAFLREIKLNIPWTKAHMESFPG